MISSVEDDKTLLDVYHVLKGAGGEPTANDWWDDLSDSVKIRIKEGLVALEGTADSWIYEEIKKSVKKQFDIK